MADKLPLEVLIHDDPYYHPNYDNNATSGTNITEEMFWGHNDKDGLYLHYTNSPNRLIRTSLGLSESAHQVFVKADCDDWLNRNLESINPNNKLYIVQGYAGSGKTIYVRRLCHHNPGTCFYLNLTDYYDSNERWIIYNCLLSFLYHDILIPLGRARKLFKVVSLIIQWKHDLSFVDISHELPEYVDRMFQIYKEISDKRGSQIYFADLLRSEIKKLEIEKLKESKVNRTPNSPVIYEPPRITGNINALMSFILLETSKN